MRQNIFTSYGGKYFYLSAHLPPVNLTAQQYKTSSDCPSQFSPLSNIFLFKQWDSFDLRTPNMGRSVDISADLLLQYAGISLLLLSQTEWVWWRPTGGAKTTILTELEENLRISEADRWLAWRTVRSVWPAPWKFLNSHSGKLNVSDINKSLTIVWLKLSHEKGENSFAAVNRDVVTNQVKTSH